MKKEARKLCREILTSEPGPGQWTGRRNVGSSLWSGKTELKMDFMFLFGKT